ncbi:hypothetical protein ACHAQJ_002519 [Trichoderma viride]
MRHVQRLKAKVLRRPASPGKSVPEQAYPTTNTPGPPHQRANLSPTESTEPSVEKRGLFKLADGKPDPSGSSNYPVDIIAVHGLNGDAFSTWRHHQDGTLWLRDLLPGFLPGCRVYTYGYPSKIFAQSSARVEEYARDLLISLRDSREDSTIGKRSVIFVCHSLGGIVFKQALVIAHQDDNLYGDVLKSVIGVAFLATPHRGSSVANLGSVFGTIVNSFMGPRAVRTDLLNHLIYDSDALQKLSTSARNRLGNISVVSCYENNPTAPLTTLVVSPASATLGIPNEELIPMFEDHRSICRFPGETESYMKLAKALRRMASQAAVTSPPLKRASTHSSTAVQHFNDIRAPSENVLIYLCQNKNKTTDGREVLIGLILQMIDRHRSMIRYVRSVFEKQGASMVQSFYLLWRIFFRIVTDPKAGFIYIILDALDECEKASCHQLLESISDMVANSSWPKGSGTTVKFLLTSRPFLRQSFISTEEALKPQISIDDNQTGYANDLQIFIQERVDEISHSRQYSNDIRDFLYQTITAKADRTFLWINVVLTSIERNLLSSRKDFQKIIASIPEGLMETYRRYLAAVPFDHQDDASQLLKLLLGSSRSLHLTELNIAFTINASHNTAEDVMQDTQNSIAHTVQGILGPLVRITDGHVSLVHQSVKDFLLEQDTAEYDSFPAMRTVNSQSSALQLATACIQYLLLGDFKVDFFSTNGSPTSPSLEISDFLDELPLGDYSGDFWDSEDHNLASDVLFREPDELHPDICDLLVSNHAFYSYASLHWAEHLAICEQVASDHLRTAAVSLLDIDTASCRNWLHFYRTRAVTWINDNPVDQDPIVLASQFNLLVLLNDLLGSCEPSQATKNRGLYWASRFGYDRILTSLLEAGAEPNSSHLDGQTALTIASEHGNLACVVKLLADERTNLNMPGPRGRNALSLACGGGHNDIVNKLLSKGCSADDPDNSGATPFFWAVGGEHHTIMSTLAKIRNVDINHRDKAGRTAISWAAGDGMADTLARLLKLPGIDVNVTDNKGKSPLSWAAGNGCANTVEVLLRSKRVNKASSDNDERNAISWASGGGHHAALAKLLNGGCPGVDADDIDGWTPLAWAIQTNTPETVRALINTELVQIDRRDGGGRTALSWAVEYGHEEVVKVLLQAGADLEAESDKRSTPISIARQLGRDDLLSVLMMYAATSRQ